MTNDEVKARRDGSELRISFVIRHSSFVICAAIIMMIAACGPQRLSKANVDQVTENMSKKQVESILGPPSEIDNKDFLVMKKTTYVYRQGKETVTIVFKDDKLVEKQSTLSK